MRTNGNASTANPIPSPGRIIHNGGSRNFGSVLFVVLFSIGVIHSINKSLNGYNTYFQTLSSPYQKPAKNADLVTGNVVKDMITVDPSVTIPEVDGTDVSNSVENKSTEDTGKENDDEDDGDKSSPAKTEEKGKETEEKADSEQSNNVEDEPKQEGGDADKADKPSEETVHENAKKDAAATTSDPNDQAIPEIVGANATIVDGETALAGGESVTEDSAVTTAGQTAEETDQKTDVPDTVTEKEDSPAAGEEGTKTEEATKDEASMDFRAKKDIPEADGSDAINEEIKEEVAEDE